MTAKTLASFSVLSLLLVAAGCSRPVTITVTEQIINPNYLGNGVEWDPYDEAISWGGALTDAQWDTLYRRLDFMQPQYVRCMINSPFTYYTGTGYDDGRNADALLKLLSYCQRNDVMVVYGEYNPPTWEMKGSQEWVQASVKHLNWLVEE